MLHTYCNYIDSLRKWSTDRGRRGGGGTPHTPTRPGACICGCVCQREGAERPTAHTPIRVPNEIIMPSDASATPSADAIEKAIYKKRQPLGIDVSAAAAQHLVQGPEDRVLMDFLTEQCEQVVPASDGDDMPLLQLREQLPECVGWRVNGDVLTSLPDGAEPHAVAKLRLRGKAESVQEDVRGVCWVNALLTGGAEEVRWLVIPGESKGKAVEIYRRQKHWPAEEELTGAGIGGVRVLSQRPGQLLLLPPHALAVRRIGAGGAVMLQWCRASMRAFRRSSSFAHWTAPPHAHCRRPQRRRRVGHHRRRRWQRSRVQRGGRGAARPTRRRQRPPKDEAPARALRRVLRRPRRRALLGQAESALRDAGRRRRRADGPRGPCAARVRPLHVEIFNRALRVRRPDEAPRRSSRRRASARTASRRRCTARGGSPRATRARRATFASVRARRRPAAAPASLLFPACRQPRAHDAARANRIPPRARACTRAMPAAAPRPLLASRLLEVFVRVRAACASAPSSSLPPCPTLVVLPPSPFLKPPLLAPARVSVGSPSSFFPLHTSREPQAASRPGACREGSKGCAWCSTRRPIRCARPCLPLRPCSAMARTLRSSLREGRCLMRRSGVSPGSQTR